jgi:hypothetical protein
LPPPNNQNILVTIFFRSSMSLKKKIACKSWYLQGDNQSFESNIVRQWIAYTPHPEEIRTSVPFFVVAGWCQLLSNRWKFKMEELEEAVASFCVADQAQENLSEKIKEIVAAKNMSREDCQEFFQSFSVKKKVTERLYKKGEEEKVKKFGDLCNQLHALQVKIFAQFAFCSECICSEVNVFI